MNAVLSQQSGLMEQVIDDKTYEFAQWGAEKSLDTLMDILDLLGMADVGEGGKLDPQKLTMALIKGMASKRVAVMRVIKRLCSDEVMCNGAPIKFDSHFAGKLPHMTRVARAALEVQFGNFFAEISRAAGEGEAGSAPAQPSPGS